MFSKTLRVSFSFSLEDDRGSLSRFFLVEVVVVVGCYFCVIGGVREVCGWLVEDNLRGSGRSVPVELGEGRKGFYKRG